MKPQVRIGKCAALALAAAVMGSGVACWGAITGSGDVTPADPSTWDGRTVSYIGETGIGSVTVNGGSNLLSRWVYVGSDAGSSGTVTIDGVGSTWNISTQIFVGREGNGALTITNGGSVSVASGTYVGPAAAPANAHGTGSINFGSNGGTLSTGFLYAAPAQLTGNGTINVHGLVSDVDMLFDSTHGLNQNFILNDVGQDVTINLDLTETGDAPGDLGVGYFGSASLTIRDGMNITSSGGILGLMKGSVGNAFIDGVGSAWTCASIVIGNYGTGTLHITNGASVSSRDGTIGAQNGGTGTISVDGSGSTWTINGDLHVGNNGSGTLEITNGSAVVVSGEAYLFPFNAAVGKINFGSNGGTLICLTLEAEPAQLTGSGTIYAHGLVSDIDLVIDATHGTNQSITLTGVDQHVTIHLDVSGTSGLVGNLGIGENGRSNLTIQDGMAVVSLIGTMGHGTGSMSNAIVDGVNSKWTVTDTLSVGVAGTGILTVRNGGEMITVRYGHLASDRDSMGSVTIDGAGSFWNCGTLFVGEGGAGTLSIYRGGAVTSSVSYVGYYSSAKGAATVDGVGSQWTQSDDFYVGCTGKGSLKITKGGVVNSSGAGYMGYNAPSTGSAIIDGDGSMWSIVDSLSVGGSGTGTLRIINGGRVSAQGVTIASNSLLAMNVGDGSSLNASTGTLFNSGTMRLEAVPGLLAGTITPIAAGSWSGSGTVLALGGQWNNTTHVFTVTAPASGSAGNTVSIDTSLAQRIVITDASANKTVWAGFQGTTTSSNLTLTGTMLSDADVAGLQGRLTGPARVLEGWNFANSGYTSGNPVALSIEVGGGYSTDTLQVWHFDGTNWMPYATSDLSYDGDYANFIVTGFSGYVVVAVPEPGVAGLLGMGSIALLIQRRRRRTETG